MKLEKTVLSEQIKERLMDDILSGKYAPGDRLVESSLSSEFGVSQSPVREALKGLEEMGLVTQEAYKGTTVREISEQDIYEAFTVRAALESIAAGLAAQKRTDEDIRSLKGIIDRLCAAADIGDYSDRMRMNNLFHDEIIRISGHKLIQKLSKTLLFTVWSHMKGIHLDGEKLQKNLRCDRKVLDAIIRQDVAAAEISMREHIEADMPRGIDSASQKAQAE
jgi:DNA-binding GntR family transcriptional regulator